MGTYPPYEPGTGSVGRRIDEAIELIEMELRHAAAYVNQAVIPQVRTESISALRTVADSLRQFADHLEKKAPTPPKDPAG
jgi:predicted transcriptional regulator